MTHTSHPADALPLPVPTHFRNGVLYAFSADQIRAARLEGYELAKREAQNGREPVAWRWRNSVGDVVTEWHDYNASAREYIEQQVREENGVIEYAYTSPPPKSDEPMDALISIGGQLASVAFNLAQRAGHALTGDDVAMLDKLRKQWDATLAAQQKGGAV